MGLLLSAQQYVTDCDEALKAWMLQEAELFQMDVCMPSLVTTEHMPNSSSHAHLIRSCLTNVSTYICPYSVFAPGLCSIGFI